MNRAELTREVRQFAEAAKQAQGQPTLADIEKARKLFDLRKESLSSEVSSNVKVKWADEPDWNSWSSLEQFFIAYREALLELDKKMLASMNARRLDGI